MTDQDITPKADYLFEVSWEVCNKVGGIYTVLTSKAEQMMRQYSKYYLIGPYIEHNARIDFTAMHVPVEFSDAFAELEREGISCHYGVWEGIDEKPPVILIDFSRMVWRKNEIKTSFWSDFGIDSLRSYWDFEEPSLWSYCAGRLIECMGKSLGDKIIAAHFHEWLSGFGLLYLKKHCKDIATVFTTHATVLGRALAGSNIDLYHNIDSIDASSEAYRMNIEAKHTTERAAALNADIFTTVSQITAIESERFLGRKPEILLYNGLDIGRFPGFEDISIKHRISRSKIREFLEYYYFPYYTFDLEKNLIFYTIGRFEFHNKGYDILIRALGRLNDMLKEDNSDHTATVLFWIPMEHHGIKLEVLENKNYYMHIKNYVNTRSTEMLTRLVYDVVLRKEHPESGLIDDSFLHDMKKDMMAFERAGSPPVSTHNIDEANNPVARMLRECGLQNRREDKVKVIIHPVYLDGNDGFIDLSYYDAILGCHLGLFASYYEPWGYTPLESLALGVPALTTDLSGFGRFLKTNNAARDGIYVLTRLSRSETDIIEDFAGIMHKFLGYTQQERTACKLNAKEVSAMADWRIFVKNYVLAHNAALAKHA